MPQYSRSCCTDSRPSLVHPKCRKPFSQSVLYHSDLLVKDQRGQLSNIAFKKMIVKKENVKMSNSKHWDKWKLSDCALLKWRKGIGNTQKGSCDIFPGKLTHCCSQVLWIHVLLLCEWEWQPWRKHVSQVSVNEERSTLMVLSLVQECVHACDPWFSEHTQLCHKWSISF